MYAIGKSFPSHQQSSAKCEIYYGGRSNEELAFLDTLLKRNNGKIFLLIYRKPTHTGQYLHYSSDQQIGCEESVFPVVQFSLFSITSKHDLSKQNTRIKGNN